MKIVSLLMVSVKLAWTHILRIAEKECERNGGYGYVCGLENVKVLVDHGGVIGGKLLG